MGQRRRRYEARINRTILVLYEIAIFTLLDHSLSGANNPCSLVEQLR
jgi:hypothetical protein